MYSRTSVVNIDITTSRADGAKADETAWPRRLPLLVSVLALTLLLLMAQTMAAQGSGGLATCNVPTAGHITIQSAIDDPACAEVNVAVGTFNENLNVRRSVTVRGQGMNSTRVDGGGLDRVVLIEPGHSVTLTQLTIANGKAQGPGGGGIFSVNSTLVLNAVAVQGNSTTQWGGGVHVYASLDRKLVIQGSRIEGNSAAEYGGGIYSAGATTEISDSLITGNSASTCAAISNSWTQTDRVSTMHIVNSIVEKNLATGTGGTGGLCNDHPSELTLANSLVSGNLGTGYQGGGIKNEGFMLIENSTISENSTDGDGGGIANTGTLTITHSTISNNTAPHGGRGGAIVNSYATLALDHCTITGNSAAGDGGGVYVWGTDNHITIYNCTFSGNSAVHSGGAMLLAGIYDVRIGNSTIISNAAGRGGGVFAIPFADSPATAFLGNSIVAGNGSGGDCAGLLASQGFNIDSDGTCQLTAVGDQPNTDPLLGPLENNGGPTLTHALLPGSPAIDAGNPLAPGSGGSACQATDQRGVARPQDGDEDGTARCDIGAFEFWTPTSSIYLPVVQSRP